MKFKVNGKDYDADVEADMPLLWVLRDVLGLTGTKFGCGRGLCGACTVHIDGKPVKSCITMAEDASGKAITTIEGLAASGDHACLKAWAELDVVQCGYCQPGQVMRAVALIAKSPSPTDAEIDTAMGGNLCRCGTYQRIKAAVKRSAEIAGGK